MKNKAELIASHFPLRRRALSHAEMAAATQPFYHAGKKFGVLLIHGFTGTPEIWQSLTNQLIELNFTVSCPLLAGHGHRSEDLLFTTWQDWLQSVDHAFTELTQQCDQIAVIGHSLGGALALQLAAKYTSIKKLFLIAPAVYPKRLLTFAIKTKILSGLIKLGIRFFPSLGGNIKKPDAWEACYPNVAIPALLEIYDCMKATQKILPQVKTSLTIFQSRRDLLIPTERIPELMRKIGSTQKELIWFDHSYHVVLLDNDAKKLAEKIISRLNGEK